MDAEQREMLGIDVVDYSLPIVFQNRMTAIKEVLDKMSPGDREDLHIRVEEFKRTGLPEDIQRR